MLVLGIDAGASYTGLALVQSAPTMADRLVVMHAACMGDLDYWSRVQCRVWPWLEALRIEHGLPDRVVVERAPDTARSDANHGPQGLVGWVQGYVAGLCVSAAAQPACPPATPQPTEWRDRLLVYAAREGFVMERPTRASLAAQRHCSDRLIDLQANRFRQTSAARRDVVRDGFWLRYRCCGTESFVPGSYVILQANGIPNCAKCAPAPSATKSEAATDADDIRDAWKALSCSFVRHFWPTQYRYLVDGARSRSRTAGTPDHKLAGVSDACEAVGIAFYSLE